jgi:hypothetical protein
LRWAGTLMLPPGVRLLWVLQIKVINSVRYLLLMM